MPTVILSQAVLLQYRMPLLQELRQRLQSEGIRLRLLHGVVRGSQALQGDEGRLPWAECVVARRVPGTRGRGLWIPIPVSRDGADLVIVPEAAGWVPTYELLLRRRSKRFVLACWGHGPSEDDHAQNRLTRKVRRRLAPKFDWWFSYTSGSTQRLIDAGVPSRRVTTLFNTVDVTGLRRELARATRERDMTRGSYRLTGTTAVFLGALTTGKGIDVLLQAGAELARQIPDFTLVVCGDGPLRRDVEAAVRHTRWLRYAGPVFGMEKARILAAADLMLQPRMVGLVAADAFAAGLPLVMFDQAHHGPEEEYVIDGVHGCRVPGNQPLDLASATAALVDAPQRMRRMAGAAWNAGSELTIERMADRFVQGIKSALALG